MTVFAKGNLQTVVLSRVVFGKAAQDTLHCCIIAQCVWKHCTTYAALLYYIILYGKAAQYNCSLLRFKRVQYTLHNCTITCCVQQGFTIHTTVLSLEDFFVANFSNAYMIHPWFPLRRLINFDNSFTMICSTGVIFQTEWHEHKFCFKT